jgi:hypothetical protein
MQALDLQNNNLKKIEFLQSFENLKLLNLSFN